MKRLFPIFFLLFLGSSTLSAQMRDLPIVPKPQHVQWLKTQFTFSRSGVSLHLAGTKSEQVQIAIHELTELLAEKKIHVDSSAKRTNVVLNIGLPANDEAFLKLCRIHHALPDSTLGDEGYRLLIEKNSIILAANHQRGLFYGIQSLKQMIRAYGTKSLPGIFVTDFPAFPYRGIMDDISRGPVPTMEYMKFQIRRMAELKINLLMQYVEHVVKTKSHPEFAPADGSLTIDEWRELAEYGRKYNVIVAGSFQSFGHFENILQSPADAHLGECGTLLSPVLPESYRFLSDVYGEMIPAFHAPFFNVNCDETFDLGKGASKTLVDSLGYAEVYYRHIMKLYDIVKKNSSTMMLWGDVLLAYPELLQKLPKDVLVGSWTYDDLPSYRSFIDPFVNHGIPYLAVPGVLNSGKLFPNYKQTRGNIDGWTRAAKAHGARGVLTTIWDERGMPLFTNDWYGAAYAADKSWHPDSSAVAEFDRRWCSGVYGASGKAMAEAIHVFERFADYEPTDGMNDNMFYNRVLPDSGKALQVSRKDWPQVMSDTRTIDSLLKASGLQFYKEDAQSLSFTASLYSLVARERIDILQAADASFKADSLAATDLQQATECLRQAAHLLNDLALDEQKQKQWYVDLWHRENRDNALTRFTDPYKQKINALDNVEQRLRRNLASIEKNSRPALNTMELGLSITPLTGKYFTDWLMTNPYSSVDTMALSQIDYLRNMGGELRAMPKVTQEFVYDSVVYRWSRKRTDSGGCLNVTALYTQRTHMSVLYAYATIQAPSDIATRALTGGEGGVQIMVNGEEVFRSAVHTGEDASDSTLVHLHKGQNTLMIKLLLHHGSGNFFFRLPDVDVRNHKNRYEIIETKHE